MKKRIVLTGATRGLGRALVDWLTAQGCEIHACGRSTSGIRALKDDHPEQSFESVDVSDDEAVEKWASAILSKSGAPDLLINNAATIAPNSPLWKLSAAQVDPVIQVNVLGFAAQKTLGNLLAGIQIAISQPIRIDDVVIVEGKCEARDPGGQRVMVSFVSTS